MVKFYDGTDILTMENDSGADLLIPGVRFEDDTRFDVQLVDDDLIGDADNKGASLKSDFIIQGTTLGGGEEQGPRVIDEIVSNALVVQCDLAQIIHGTMVKDGSPATLLVFQFAFVPRGNRRRFEQAEITITFSAGDVHAITPSNTWATLQSEKVQELSHSVSPGLEATFGPGKATMGYTWQLKESKTIDNRSSIVGLSRMLGQSRNKAKARMNTVFWGLYENPDTKSGIPSFMQTAVLLKRDKVEGEPLGQKFSADITICGKVDNRKWVKDKWENVTRGMSGNSRKGEEVIFNLEKNRGTVEDADNLIDVKLDNYKQLVTIRPWADGDERPLEQAPEHPEAPEIELAGQPPSKSATNTISTPTVPSATAIDSHSIDRVTRAVAQHIAPSGISNESYESRIDVATLGLTNVALGDSTSGNATSQDRATSLSSDRKKQRLKCLEEEVLSVRHEMTLITQLISLVREERRIMQEIKELKD